MSREEATSRKPRASGRGRGVRPGVRELLGSDAPASNKRELRRVDRSLHARGSRRGPARFLAHLGLIGPERLPPRLSAAAA